MNFLKINFDCFFLIIFIYDVNNTNLRSCLPVVPEQGSGNFQCFLFKIIYFILIFSLIYTILIKVGASGKLFFCLDVYP